MATPLGDLRAGISRPMMDIKNAMHKLGPTELAALLSRLIGQDVSKQVAANIIRGRSIPSSALMTIIGALGAEAIERVAAGDTTGADNET